MLETLFRYRNWIIGTLFLIVIILYGIYIKMENDFSTKGKDLFETLQESKRLKAENVQINELVLYYSSFQYIKPAAFEMGFVESTSNDYITIYANQTY